MSGCKIKAFGTAYYSIPCGLITTVFSLTLSNLVSVPNLEEGERHFFLFFFSNYATIVKLNQAEEQTLFFLKKILENLDRASYSAFESSVKHSFQSKSKIGENSYDSQMHIFTAYSHVHVMLK